MRLSSLLRAAALSALLTTAPALAQDTAPTNTPPRTPEEIYADLDLLGRVFDMVRAEYVDEPDERELIRAAIQGMLQSLDPHSTYLDPDNYAEVTEGTSGEFGGLGIEIEMDQGVVKVISPIDDTPAAKAGILANDLIVEIDGVAVLGLTSGEAVEMMRGAVGTKIQLTIVREGVTEPIEMELVRDTITLRTVRWSMDRDVGILRLAKFTAQSYSGIESAIRDIYEERNGVAPKGFILDLRNNPGGLLDQSVYVSDAFLKQGAVVLTRGREEQESERYDAKPDDLDRRIADVPLIVLINGGSASAAEIVAGALQDHKRATVIGTRSFGKGSVQSIIPLPGNGGMRITTSRYYTPNNTSIQASGIIPDIEVFQDVPEEFKGRDEIIGEAALPGHIDGGSAEEAQTGSSVYVPADRSKDSQINYAISLILGEETHPAFPARPDA